MFISEIAPQDIRGGLGTSNQVGKIGPESSLLCFILVNDKSHHILTCACSCSYGQDVQLLTLLVPFFHGVLWF
jgi:hypothetical protein